MAIFLSVFLQSFFLNAQKKDQYITFDIIPDKSCTDTVFYVNASSDSGLPVTFDISSGPATVSGNKITLQKIDFRNKTSQISIIVTASQKGNEIYNEATEINEKFDVKTDFLDSLASASFYQSGNITVTSGDSITLKAKKIAGLDYLWTLPNHVTYQEPDIVIPNATTSLSGVYLLNISTGACTLYSNSSQVNVLPKPTPPAPKEDSTIYVYKIITPNNDQKNDHFSVKNIDKYTHKLSIFDLWGNMVFQSTNYNKEWPSTDIASGEYYYTLDIPSMGKTYSGGILVLKE